MFNHREMNAGGCQRSGPRILKFCVASVLVLLSDVGFSEPTVTPIATPPATEAPPQSVSPNPSVAPSQQISASPQAGGGYQLNFTDTDLAAVVAAVLGDGLNVTYSIDPQVKGTITLQAARPLTREETLAALEAALRMQGAAMIESNGNYHIVPLKDAPRRITTLRTGSPRQAGYGIYIVPLQYVSAEEMERVLQPFAPDGEIVRVDHARNMLLLAGTSQEIAMLMGVINTFDVNWLAGMSFALFPLEYVDAKTIAGELSEVFEDNKSPIAGVVRIVPMSRLNALMVVTPQAQYVAEVEKWIRRLDVAAASPGRRIYVYDVQNGKADDLARTLSDILSIPYDSTQSSGSTSTTATSASGGAPAPTVPAVPSPQRYAGQVNRGLDEATVRIVPSPENNSLLILATPSEYTLIENALKRLDVVPLQVLIEASIAEVTLNDNLQFGLQWSYLGQDTQLALSQSSSGTINQSFPGFSALYTGRTSIRAVLNSIESLTDVHVLSAPKLLVLNNHQADLQIGDQVPITVQSSQSTAAGTAPIVNSVQLHDTGVILHVTPRANKSGRVLLEVSQEVSDVVPTTTSGIDSPTIQQRKLSSVVSVSDGETIALGGLIRDSKTRTRSGLPWLRRIPFLGTLFGSTSRTGLRTEVVVLITPKVIRTSDESSAVMEDLRLEFRDLKRLVPQWKTAPPTNATPPAL